MDGIPASCWRCVESGRRVGDDELFVEMNGFPRILARPLGSCGREALAQGEGKKRVAAVAGVVAGGARGKFFVLRRACRRVA